MFLALTFLITSDADADEVPTIIFTERGIYLSTNPDERINIGERLSLMDLGRRFSSCRVMQEYYSGDQEGIQTTIRCRPGGRFPTIGEDDSSDVSVHLDLDKTGKVFGFSTRTKGPHLQIMFKWAILSKRPLVIRHIATFALKTSRPSVKTM